MEYKIIIQFSDDSIIEDTINISDDISFTVIKNTVFNKHQKKVKNILKIELMEE